jgi:hypothetical protein
MNSETERNVDLDTRQRLDAMVREAEAQGRSAERTAAIEVPALIEAVADHGGHLPLREVHELAEVVSGGHAEEVLVALLEPPSDKRRGRLAGIGTEPDGEMYLWLERSAYRLIGSNTKGGRPSGAQRDHRLWIRSLAGLFEHRYATRLTPHGIQVAVAGGAQLRRRQEERRQSARDAVIVGGPTAHGEGGSLLLGGVYPDLLLEEAWPSRDNVRQMWPHLLTDARDRSTPLDVAVAVEVEVSRKTREAMSIKVQRHRAQATIARPAYWHVTLWVVDDTAIAQLIRSRVEDIHGEAFEATGHYLLDARTLSGVSVEHSLSTWPGSHLLDR